jgi:hypothetical protein
MSSRIFSSFSVILLVLGRPERSSSTDTQPALKHELSRLKNDLKILTKHFKGLAVNLPNFTLNLVLLILPSIADKMKHEVKKALL